MPTTLEYFLSRYPDDLVKHTQLTRNHGLLGGFLYVEFWCYKNGEPTGFTKSECLPA